MSDSSRQAAVPEFHPDEEFARDLDAADPLAGFRHDFHIPERHGTEVAYLCGNSLGLQPVGVVSAVRQELEDWGALAVDAHFRGRNPWFTYHEGLRDPLARLVGAEPQEVVAMNSLTVNLHLLLVSFYRPTPSRFKILIEEHAFPSDRYAAQSQLRFHGFDPSDGLLVARARPGEQVLRTEDLEALLEQQGEQIALVLFGGVNYYTGQRFDIGRIGRAARERGCVVGFDLAHAVGNVPLGLHRDEIDFAVWCSYKYLNAGPGAIAGCFVHARHLERDDLPRFAGWWGNDPESRFRMHAAETFVPVPRADGWQLSNPSILSAAPLRASLRLFDGAELPRLCAKAERMTSYLEAWVDHVGDPRMRVITPRRHDERGCQLSLQGSAARELFDALQQEGVVGDYRDPDVVRLAPVPLYNSFHDVWRCGRSLLRWSRGG